MMTDEITTISAIESLAGRPVRSIVRTATILREGWEMDNRAWLVLFEDGSTEAWTTSHGGACLLSASELDDHIATTRASLQELEAIKRELEIASSPLP